MQKKSLNFYKIKWFEKKDIENALKKWANKILSQHKNILKIGYFGSYAKGNWNVGSDIDILIIVESSSEPFYKRSLLFDTLELPIPADLFVYTESELIQLKDSKFVKEVVKEEVIWIYKKNL